MSSGYCVKRSKKAVKKLLFTRYYPAKRVTENGVNSNRYFFECSIDIYFAIFYKQCYDIFNRNSIKEKTPTGGQKL